jgi:peptidoglycan/LPS O-acetylase OafA/YrhL
VSASSDRVGTSSPSALHLTTSSQRVPELDGLRGLAIFFVLVCHYVGASDSSKLPFLVHKALRATSIGWSGVDLFFVLSGFLIGGILLESKQSPRYFRTFYLRRLHRIFPIYYGWIFLYCALVVTLSFLKPGNYSVGAYLKPVLIYVLFVQNFFFNKMHLEWIWFAVIWSLAIEEQFYLCAPLLIWKLSKERLKTILIVIVMVVPLFRLAVYSFGPAYRFLAAMSTFCRVDELAIGVLLALLWRDPAVRKSLVERPRILDRLLIFFFVAFCVLLYWFEYGGNWFSTTIGYTVIAGWFAALLLFALCRPTTHVASFLRLKPLQNLGMISYCVYIIHSTVLSGMHKILLHGPPQLNNMSGITVTVAALIVSIGLASVSWRLIEKPLIRRGHRYTY